jgi:hypothetical protein
VFPSVKASAYGFTPANPNIAVHMQLSADRLPAGSHLEATVVLTNRSDKTINLTSACRPIYAVLLANQSNPPGNAGFSELPPGHCQTTPLLVHPGTNRWRTHVPTTAFDCSSAASGPHTTPTCTKTGGLPPLPSGTYYAVLVGSDLPLPAPSPVPVTLTEPTS